MAKNDLSPLDQKIADALVKHRKELCAALRKQLFGCATPTIAILMGEDPEDVKKRYVTYLEGVREQHQIEQQMHKEVWEPNNG